MKSQTLRAAAAAAALAGGLPFTALSAQATAPKEFASVVTADARTQRGLFTVHQVRGRVLFEIPVRELDKDMMLLQGVSAGHSFSGGRGVYRWEREGNRIHLRRQDVEITANAEPLARAVRRAQVPAIIATFPIEAFAPGTDSAAVIDVTRLFTGMPGFSAVSGIQQEASRVDRVTVFPRSILIIGTQTGNPFQITGTPGSRVGTVKVSWNIIKLSDPPMRPRLHDPRVDVDDVSIVDYGRQDHYVKDRKYVTRFRLEKRDPSARVSDVVQPIVFWIDPATPPWLIPYIKAGVADWLPAFEDAGFRNAIVAREAPDSSQDPSFSMDDATRSVIEWNTELPADWPYEAPAAGATSDPRSGEIIRGHVGFPHRYLNKLRPQYVLYLAHHVRPTGASASAGSNGHAAAEFPASDPSVIPDTILGALVRRIIAHEVGHGIGLPQYDAWASYPIDSARSAAFLNRVARHVPTIMGLQYNYVAQPEDGVPFDLLLSTVGPYDRFAIRWMHEPIPNAQTPVDELPTLDAWIKVRDANVWTRPIERDAPRSLSGGPSIERAVAAARYGLRNLVLAVANLDGVSDRTLLEETYRDAVALWGQHLRGATFEVGGIRNLEAYGSGPRLQPLPRARQREAVVFLLDSAMVRPTWLLDARLLGRMRLDAASLIMDAQTEILDALLGDARLGRLLELEREATRPSDVYTAAELLNDVRRGLWRELDTSAPRIDSYRRASQHAFISIAEGYLNPASGTNSRINPNAGSEVRAILRRELSALNRQIENALPRSADAPTTLHLEDARVRVLALLES